LDVHLFLPKQKQLIAFGGQPWGKQVGLLLEFSQSNFAITHAISSSCGASPETDHFILTNQGT
jgi:hypothetical protein